MEGLPDMRNLLQVERLILPSPPSSLIQNLCDLAVTVMIQQSVDLGDYLRFRLPDLSDWQRLRQGETASSTAAETHMCLDPLTVDQCHIFDEQAENAFPLARFDGRIIPYARKILGQ